MFDEAWYCKPLQSPAIQLIYSLGWSVQFDLTSNVRLDMVYIAQCPPIPNKCMPHKPTTPIACQLTLHMQLTDEPRSIAARAIDMTKEQHYARVQYPYKNTVLVNVNLDDLAIDWFCITKHEITQVFFSPSPYRNTVKEIIKLQ